MKKFIAKDIASLIDVFHKLNYILNRNQKRLSVLILCMTIVGALFETLGVSIIIPLVQAFVSPEKLLNYRYIRLFADSFHIVTTKQLVVSIAAMVILIYVFKNMYMTLLSFARLKFSVKVRRELSVKMMESYMEREYVFFLGANTADIIRSVAYDVTGVYSILFQMFHIIAEVLTAACICVFIVKTDVVMAVSVIVLMGVALSFLLLIFQNKMKRSGDIYREWTGKVNKYLYEAFQGVKDVIVFRREQYFIDQYEVSFSNQQDAEVAKTFAAERPPYFIEAFFVSGLIAVVGFKVLAGHDASGFLPELGAFAIAAFRILPSVGRISANFNQFVYACPALNAAYDNLREVENYKKESRIKEDGSREKKAFREEIVIRDMYWKYPNASGYVIEGLDLVIRKGKSIALIGESGAGKSTLADILLGLLVPEQGDVLVDGVSIYDMMTSWKMTIGYVPQAVFLTDDTIRNNIAFGMDEKEIDEAKLRKAVEKAQLMDTIEKLPAGLDTILGERGTRFSGGQRQRVAIARALYNDPDILILDEATAALDNDTENAVMEAIDALQGYKTLVIIAHRLTTIRNCDEIYEIKDGKAFRREKQEIFSQM